MQAEPVKNLGAPAPPACRQQTLLAPWDCLHCALLSARSHLLNSQNFSPTPDETLQRQIKRSGGIPRQLPPALPCQEGHWQGRHLLPKVDLSCSRKIWRQANPGSRAAEQRRSRAMSPWRRRQRRDWQQQLLRLGLVRDCHEAVAPLPLLPGPQRMLKCSRLMTERVRR